MHMASCPSVSHARGNWSTRTAVDPCPPHPASVIANDTLDYFFFELRGSGMERQTTGYKMTEKRWALGLQQSLLVLFHISGTYYGGVLKINVRDLTCAVDSRCISNTHLDLTNLHIAKSSV